ncbi:bactofilin family protein [Lacimonas salitolerans]|uniref:Polymer-forming cytoskeletal protein n=1 Tax=Lacimonas salitolerans TaxID=1323750 RepID=A0ABW4EL48_9RHOB
MFAKSQDNSQNSPSPLSSAEAAASNTRRSVLHEGITIKGEWTSDGIVDFGGTFEGDLTVDTLVLAKTGKIKGNVRARSVTIEGRLEGTISAISVALKTSAQVTADIVAQKLVIESGATIEGHVASRSAQTPDQESGSPTA